MSDPNEKHSLNVSGAFYVDDTCIDCDLCRDAVPNVFARDDAGTGTTYVHHQPRNQEEVDQALAAADSCPTESIGADG